MIRPDHFWVFITVLFSLAFFLAAPKAHPRELYPGQYAQVDPATREWFRSQRIPGGEHAGGLCCSEADGVYAEEDIINNRYWTRWRLPGDILTAWQPVPPEAVLQQGNRNGAAVVWWFYRDGIPVIRCFAPGAGI